MGTRGWGYKQFSLILSDLPCCGSHDCLFVPVHQQTDTIQSAITNYMTPQDCPLFLYFKKELIQKLIRNLKYILSVSLKF